MEDIEKAEDATVAAATVASNDPHAKAWELNAEETVQETGVTVQRGRGTPAEFLELFHPGGPWFLSTIADAEGAQPVGTWRATPGDVAMWAARNDGEVNLYFNPATVRAGFDGNKASKDNIVSTRWLWTDPDPFKLTDADVARMNEEERRAYYTGESAEIVAIIGRLEPKPTIVIDSGNGYQPFWRLREPMPCGTPEEQDEVEARMRWLGEQIGDRADNTWNVDRLMRVPGTMNIGGHKKRAAGISWKSEARIVEELTDLSRVYAPDDFKKAPRKGAAGGGAVIAFPRELPAVDLDRLLPGDQHARLRELIRTGQDPEREEPYPSRSEALYAAVCRMARHVDDDAAIAAILMDGRYQISESVLEKRRGARRYAERQVSRARAEAVAAKSEFKQTRRGIVPSYENARLAIQKLGITCEEDAFSERLVIGGHAIQEWQGELSDKACSRLRQLIIDEYKLDPGKDNVRDAVVNLCVENPRHPIREYLDEQEARWDGVRRIDAWLPLYLGARDTPLNRAIGRLVLIAAVRRVRQPGAKFDFVTIIEGQQGVGKSTLVRRLARDRRWFSDEELLGLEPKQRIEALVPGITIR